MVYVYGLNVLTQFDCLDRLCWGHGERHSQMNHCSGGREATVPLKDVASIPEPDWPISDEKDVDSPQSPAAFRENRPQSTGYHFFKDH